MSSAIPENPYEPPKAELEAEPSSVTLRRPASTKVLVTFLSLHVLFLAWQYGAQIGQEGIADWLTRRAHLPLRSINALLIVSSWLILLFSGPRKIGYWIGTLNLALLVAQAVAATIVEAQRNPGLFHSPAGWGVLISMPIIVGLPSLLFYRFTFGLPSRRYYGVGAAKNATGQ